MSAKIDAFVSRASVPLGAGVLGALWAGNAGAVVGVVLGSLIAWRAR